MNPVTSHRTTAVAALACLCSALLAALLWRRRTTHAPSALCAANPATPISTPRRIQVLCGSVGGTAKRFATQLADELANRTRGSSGGDPAVICDVEHTLDSSGAAGRFFLADIVLVVVATSGNGECPSQLSALLAVVEHLYKAPRATRSDVTPTKFSVFGLGDSSYRKYCEAAQIVHRCLLRCGCEPLSSALHNKAVHTADFRDSQRTQECVFEYWMEALWDALRAEGVPISSTVHITESPRNTLRVSEAAVDHAHLQPALRLGKKEWRPFPAPPSGGPPTLDRPAHLSILRTMRCHSSSSGNDRTLVCLVLSTSEYPALTYAAGDHLAVLAPNPVACVERLLTFFLAGSRANETIRLERLDYNEKARARAPDAFPHEGQLTWLRLFQWHVDIGGPVRASTLRHLIRSANCSETEKHHLLQHVVDVAVAEAHARRQSLVEVLERYFAVCASVPLVRVAECLPRQRPRLYSIASDPNDTPGEVHLLVRHVQGGVASSHLALPPLPSAVFAFVQKSAFHLPQNKSVPLILVGPGTGIGPLLGFLRERSEALRKQPGRKLSTCLLYYGCRTRAEWTDFLENLIGRHLADGSLTRVSVAHSRETPQFPKRYVQDDLRGDSSDLVRLLVDEHATVFVCGDKEHMARGVYDTFVEMITPRLGGRDAAASFFDALCSSHKYLEDVW